MSFSFITPDSKIEFLLDTTKRLGRGATANVYKVKISDKIFAVKIYNDSSKVDWSKLTLMTELSYASNYDFVKTHAWPVGLIQENGMNVGFAMPLFDLDLFSTVDHYYDNILRGHISDKQLLALPNLILIAKNLCFELEKFHEAKIFLVDIKPQNIVVNTTTNEVVLLDCDGFSIEKDNQIYPASLVSSDYIAPEVTINRTSPQKLGLAQDLYGLSVLIFQLLNRGLHPYSGRFTSEIEATTNDDKATLGKYAYGTLKSSEVTPHVASLHTMWASSIVETFENCFTGGARASASEWSSLFDDIERGKGYKRCDKFPNDALHIRFKDKHCMQCRLDSLQATHPPKTSPSEKTQAEKPLIPPRAPPKKDSITFWVYFLMAALAFLIIVEIWNKQSTSSSSGSTVSQDVAANICTSMNPNACTAAELCIRGTTGTNEKRWISSGTSVGYANAAKRRGLSCGVTENISSQCGDRNTKACSNSVICNYATKKEFGVRKWATLPSFVTYVAEAKRRNLSCSVKQPAAARTCYTDISVCSKTTICRQATKDRNGKAMWDERPQFAKYVSEAKRRGLPCGVTTAPSKECGRNYPQYCSPSIICNHATKMRTGFKIWETLPAFVPFVNEAKRRGLNCGITEAEARTNTKTKTYYNMSIIGNDLIKGGYYNTTEFLCAELCRSNPKCEAVSFHIKHRSCWLKPSMAGIKRLNGVNTTEIFR